MMFDTAKVKEIAVRGRKEQWPYPRVFNALKAAGVDYYEARVGSHEVTYHGDRHRWMEPPARANASRSIAKSFDEAAIKAAIGKYRVQGITCAEFLAALASAGVSSYRVDITDRTVTYMGKATESYIEKVPPFAGDIEVVHPSRMGHVMAGNFHKGAARDATPAPRAGARVRQLPVSA